MQITSVREREKAMRGTTLEQEGPVAMAEASLSGGNGLGLEPADDRTGERNMGAQSSQVALNVMSLVRLHVSERKLGKTFGTDCGYQLPGDLKKPRFPDGSFVARGRLPEDRTPEGNMKIAPDFALEVVSPNDSAYEVEEKRVVYLRAGVHLLWIIFPQTRTLFVYRPGGVVAVLGEGDTVSDEDVLPGFACSVARFFVDL
jgi:Uma2 family endonuclease